MQVIRKIIEKMTSYLCNYKCGRSNNFVLDEKWIRTDE